MPGRQFARFWGKPLILAEVREGAGEHKMQARQPDHRSNNQSGQSGQDSFQSRLHEKTNLHTALKIVSKKLP